MTDTLLPAVTDLPQERRLVTELPGPRSRALMERRAAAVSAGVGGTMPVFAERAGGGVIVDVDGNSLIDLGSGIAVTNVGNADPQALWTNTPIVQMNMDTAQSLESPVQESVESRTNHENSVRKSTSVAARPRLPVQKNGKNILIPAIGSAFVLSSCFAIFYTQTDFSIKALANDLLSLATSKTEPQVPPAQLEQAPMSEPSTTSPAPIKAMPEPDQPVTARVQALGFGGCDAQKPAITLSTDQPQKAGLSVYIEALEEVSLCVEDSAGVQHAASLKANENKTFRGTPPWSVHASDPAKIQLFFQGRKFHWPEVKDAFVILKETWLKGG